ncbi:ATP-dependent DNA ligase [Candidatus Woesearchaeota archaeon]|nr:ATP-dependent DNA ligase [Candidatus Woesearchaeota archaeon]
MKFVLLASAYESLGAESKRLKKTKIICDLLRNADSEDLGRLILLLQGKVFNTAEKQDLGIASKIVIKAMSSVFGSSTDNIENLWRNKGDLGVVAQDLASKKKQNVLFKEELFVEEVFSSFRKLASLEGTGSVDNKIKIISRLLSLAEPLEAKFVVRIALQDLRVGVAEGTLRDAIAWAFLSEAEPNYDDGSINPENREKYNEVVDLLQSVIDKTNDFEIAALTAKKGLSALKEIRLVVGKPLKVMLAQKAPTIKDAFKSVGVPAILEYKYDGFRMQIHKNGEVKIFTRRLEDVTAQFPEVKEYVEHNVEADSFILDCEAVGYNPETNKYTSFQNISQRIKRKYNIEELAKKLPIELNVFDVLYLNGEDLLNKPFSERRKIIESLIKEVPKKIVLSKKLITSDEDEANKFFEESVALGNEGLMFKNLEGTYKPGARVGSMVKFKSSMDALDLVIVGAEWGEGKRSGWLTSFTLACVSDSDFLELGKVGTGLKEKPEEGLSFQELTDLLKPLIVEEKGRDVKVKPEVVVSVLFEEIQKSPSYAAGFALRFPRIVALRSDRKPDDVLDVEHLEDLYYEQKKS